MGAGKSLIFLGLLGPTMNVAAELPANVQRNAKAAKAAISGKAKAQTPPLAAQPQPTVAEPVVPLRPSNMPPVPPRVSFQNGKLTVVAENSTLADIFAAIRQAAGIQIDAQGGGSSDRVAAKIGPATPREVLLSLLRGSRFDYVMMGAMQDPDRIERVVLAPRNASAASTATVSGPLRPAAPEMPQEEDYNAGEDEDTGPPPVRGPDREPAAVVAPGQPQPIPGQSQPNPAGSVQPVQPGQQPGQEVKSPEQILEELRQMEQQRRQQQNMQRPR